MSDEINKDTVDYRDPTPFDDTKLNSITEISKGIRHKLYGKDTREALAQQGEALVKLMQETGGNQSAEVVAARGNFGLLGIRETAQDNAIIKAQSTADSKFDTDQAESYLKSITAVPETFVNLAAIKAKYPSGKNGLMVAADNGHKYIWTNNTWTDAGIYQSAGIADKSVTSAKLAPGALSLANLARKNNVISALGKDDGKKITGYNTSTGALIKDDQTDGFVVRYKFPHLFESVEIPLPSQLAGQFVVAYKSPDDTDVAWNVTFDALQSKTWDGYSGQSTLSDDGKSLIFYGPKNPNYYDIATIKGTGKLNHIYIGFNTADTSAIYENGSESLLKSLSESIDANDVIDPQDVTNARRSKLNQFDAEITPYTLIMGEEDDGSLDLVLYGSVCYAKFSASKLGDAEVLVTKYSAIPYGQAFVFTDKDDKVVARISFSDVILQANGVNTTRQAHRYVTVRDGLVYLNVGMIMEFYSGIASVYVAQDIDAYNNGLTLYALATQAPQPWEKRADTNEASLCYKVKHAEWSKSFDISTGKPVIDRHNGVFMRYYHAPKSGQGHLKVPSFTVPTLPNGTLETFQFCYVLNTDGTVAVAGNFTIGDDGKPIASDYYTVSDDVIDIDLSLLSAGQDLVLSFPSYLISTFTESYEGVFTADEINPAILLANDKLTDDNFNLPPYLPLVSGKETYIYFDNLLIGHNLYCDPLNVYATNQQGDKAVINVTESHNQSLFYEGKTKFVPISVVPATAGSGKKLNLMVIGESTSESADYLSALNGDFVDDTSLSVTLVGSRGDTVKHEAYSGWGIGTLRYMDEANNRMNAFYNPAKKEFDLDYYFAQHPDVPVPDVVLLNFGINDVNRYTDGKTGTQTEHYEWMIEQFKAKNPACIFVIALSHSYTRWSNYWFTGSRDQIMRRTKQTMMDFRDREDEHIYLNPWYVCLDMQWDFDHRSVPRNQFDTSDSIEIATNTVHPAKSGYQNTALMSYMAVKYALYKESK